MEVSYLGAGSPASRPTFRNPLNDAADFAVNKPRNTHATAVGFQTVLPFVISFLSSSNLFARVQDSLFFHFLRLGVAHGKNSSKSEMEEKPLDGCFVDAAV